MNTLLAQDVRRRGFTAQNDWAGEKLRKSGLRVIAVLVGLVFVTVGPAAAAATAETLVYQSPGPSGVTVRSDETAEWNEAFDDFDVPPGTHWRIEGIQVFGAAASEHPRTFNVKIRWGGGGTFPLDVPEARVFSERVTVAGGPDYLIPIEGAPRLDHPNDFEPGQYWISVQAVSAGGEDDWSWLTGPDTPGTAPAYLRGYATPVTGAEPGLAFRLLGTATQIVKASTYGAGAIVSTPPGISCPGACVAEFPRGTTLTLAPAATKASVKFTEWGFRHTGFAGRSNELVPIQIPSPCSGTGDCAFTLNQDTNVGAVFDPIDEVTVLRVVHHPRTGRGALLVWAPGEGALGLESSGLRGYFQRTVPAGTVRIPLIPTKEIAKTLRKKGRATVSAKVEFRATEMNYPGTTQVPVTLVQKASGTAALTRH